MTLPSLGAAKICTIGLTVAWAFAVAMDPTVKVAIIAAIPPTVSSLVWGWVNHKKISTVEVNTNNKLTQILAERNTATSRADKAEGRREGVEATQDKEHN